MPNRSAHGTRAYLRVILALFLSGLLMACDGLSTRPLSGPYVLLADDELNIYGVATREEHGNWGYEIMNVQRIGHTEAFIVTKALEGYFIVRVADRRIFGPLRESRYRALRVSLGVPTTLQMTTLPPFDLPPPSQPSGSQ